MSHATTLTAGLACQPGLLTDHQGNPVPPRIAEVFHVVSILVEYGRFLADIIDRGAAWRGFPTVARFFGTAAIPVILLHLRRGIMRGVALQQMLLLRSERRRDLVPLAPRVHVKRAAAPLPPEEPAPEEPAPEELPDHAADQADTPPQTPPARRGAAQQPPTRDTMPTLAQLRAQVRHRPVGQTIADICRDLGVSPALCAGGFWNDLFDAIRLYRGSIHALYRDIRRREQCFAKEDWMHPELPLPEDTRDGVRRVLGFFIGVRCHPDLEIRDTPG